MKNEEAYALVTATFRGVRHVLLIETDAGWAMPGGGVEPGEEPGMTAVRELREETGLDLTRLVPVSATLDEPRWVPDPRGSMEAWSVTVVARCDLGPVDALPEVHPADGENKQVRWMTTWVARSVSRLAEDKIFPAHREILGALR